MPEITENTHPMQGAQTAELDDIPNKDNADGNDDGQVKEAASYGRGDGSASPVLIPLEPRIIEALDEAQAGHDIRVTIIQGGTSKNGFSYDDSALQQIARMIEGAKAYADHSDTGALVRSVRDVVGFYHDAQFIPATAGDPAHVDATLHLFDAADWLWKVIQESCLLGRPELIGLSIDIMGNWQHSQATGSKQVTHVAAMNSCDIVTRPSAGGTFRRILHDEGSQNNHSYSQNIADSPQDQANTSQIRRAKPMPDQAITEQQNNQSPPAATNNQQPGEKPYIAINAPGQQVSQILEQSLANQQVIEQTRIKAEQMLAEARLQRAELMLERRLHESILPQAVKDQVKERFTGRVFEQEELDNELTRQINMMAQLTKDGLIHGHGYEKAQIGSQITEAEKVQAAFDAMFGLEIDTSKYAGIRGFKGLREAYARVTGDPSVIGISANTTLGQIRVSESAPIARITEADTTTASFSYLLGTSMNKRLLKDYQAWPAEWQKFCSIIPVRDFKQQTRVRFGAFASLPIVPEDTAYTAVTLQDSASTYVPQKRGNLVTVSREVIINDDLQAVKQIPTKLAVAAAYTLAEFVYGFLSANGNIYDGSALFTSGAPHSNLGSSALSTAAMQTGVTAMREQTNFAGKRIGLRPRYLIVPPELEWVAMVATKSAGVPGSSSNDINPMLGYVTPIISPQLTNTTQWFMAADPREVDTIEIGFVGGQVNPALYIQDQPYRHMQAKAA